MDVLGKDTCCVLDHDSYYRDLSHQPQAVRAATNFDHPDSLDNELLADHVHKLLAGKSIERPCYDFATHTRRQQPETIAPRPIVICEGILLLAVPKLRRSFNLRLFVDAPADVRALRRVQRDISERGRTVQSVIKQYLNTVRPMHEQFVEPARRSADVVMDWQQDPAAQAQLLLQKVRTRSDQGTLEASS